MKSQNMFIKDPEHKSDLKIYNLRGYVYIQQNSMPTNLSKSIHELDKIKVMTISYERAAELSIDYLEKKHPHYKGYIKIKSDET